MIENKITTTEITKFVAEAPTSVSSDWHGIKIEIALNLPAMERDAFIDSVVDGCINQERPYAAFDYVFRCCAIAYFTNIDLFNESQPEKLAMFTDILDTISVHTYCSIRELRDTCSKALDFKLMKQENPAYQLVDTISDFMNEISAFVTDVNPNDLSSIADALKKVDGKKLAEAMVEVGMNEKK